MNEIQFKKITNTNTKRRFKEKLSSSVIQTPQFKHPLVVYNRAVNLSVSLGFLILTFLYRPRESYVIGQKIYPFEIT